MTVGGVNVVDFGKHVAKEFSTDDISGLAAELSYRYFLALFPFFIFLAALGGFIARALNVSDPTTSFMNAVGTALPGDARSVLETQVRSVLDSQSAGLLSIGILGALWAASGAMKSLIKALNRAYDVPETRSFVRSYLLAIGLVITATLGILGSVVLYVATTAWAGDIAGWFGLGGAFELTISIARWPLIIALILSSVAFMYWAAPNLDVKFKFISPGALLFTVVWIAATLLFGFYVSNFGSYNKTYGTLGGVVVLLTWLYITNVMLLLGAEVNAILELEKDPQTVRKKRAQVASEASDADQKKAMEPRARDAALVPTSDHVPNASPPRRSAGEGRVTLLATATPDGAQASLSRRPRGSDEAPEERRSLIWAFVFGTVVALAAFGWRHARRVA
ncbi:MAG: YhjD/YihY/BrkB family envelope integrity protein [Tepidiformaceae bacterium]